MERESLPVATSAETIPSPAAYSVFRRQAVTNEAALPVNLELIAIERIDTINGIAFGTTPSDGRSENRSENFQKPNSRFLV